MTINKGTVYVLPLKEDNPIKKPGWVETRCPECSRSCYKSEHAVNADIIVCKYCAEQLLEKNKLTLKSASVVRLDTGEITTYGRRK